LFGIAASLTDAQSADVSILYLRMALYLRPTWAWRSFCWPTASKPCASSSRHRHLSSIEPSRPITAWRRCRRRWTAAAGQDDEAIAGLKKLVQSQPMTAKPGWRWATPIARSSKFAEAVEAYDHAEKAIAQASRRDWPMFYARAMSKEKLKKLDESEADIQLALKLSPEQPELLNYLGYSWVDRGRNIPQALTMLEKARTLRPYDGYIVDSVGWAYYQLGRYDDAAKTLGAAVLLVPGDPTINDHLGDALWRAGRRIEARYQWNHAITFSDSDTDKAAIEKKLKTGLTEKPA
jgi:Flp pilus assembly protein TadD